MSLLTMYVPLRRSDYFKFKLVEELPKNPQKIIFKISYRIYEV